MTSKQNTKKGDTNRGTTHHHNHDEEIDLEVIHWRIKDEDEDKAYKKDDDYESELVWSDDGSYPISELNNSDSSDDSIEKEEKDEIAKEKLE